MDTLERWLTDNGGYLHPSVRLARDTEQGLHFQTTTAIEPGTRVLTVPHQLAMSHLNAQVDDKFPVFGSHAKSFTVEALGFFYLMAQWLHKDTSFWKPYLDTLPSPDQGFDTPMYFDEHDRMWLQGTDLHPTLLAREAAWKRYWEDGVDVLRLAGMHVEQYTWQLFTWAATIYSSRSFNGRTITPEDSKHWVAYKHDPSGTNPVLLNHDDYPQDWKKFSLLFPLMDVGNHNPNARVDWTYDPESFSLSVSDRIEPASQLYNNYGPKSNEELLMGYGFCAPGNPFDGLLLAMRPPPAPLQHMLKVTHPQYFKPTGEWNSDAATFRLLHEKLQDTTHENAFTQAWAAVPAPLTELFCYVVQLERGVNVSPINNAEEFLYRSNNGKRYLPRIALYILMSLNPKLQKLQQVNDSLPPQPTNPRQATVKIYRDMQYTLINTIQDRMANYLKSLQPTSITSCTGPAIWTLESALELLKLEMPTAHQSFMSGVKYVAGTTKLRKLRGSDHEEYLWIIFVCFVYLACTLLPREGMLGEQSLLTSRWMHALVEEYGQPELQTRASAAAAAITNDDDDDDEEEEKEEEEEEEAAEYLDRVKKAAMFLPGSLWTNVAWTPDFVLDFGMRVCKSQGTYMDFGVAAADDQKEDVRYVVYLHV